MTKESFSEKVYRYTRQIPAGKVATYATLAQAIGSPGAARAVGNSLNKNPNAPQTPCHRVIQSSGQLGGFAFGANQKKRLLSDEGVKVENGKVNLTLYQHEFKAQRKN